MVEIPDGSAPSASFVPVNHTESVSADTFRGTDMADRAEIKMKSTLGLTGLTMNAMALIAPGAFLWLTFNIQSVTGSTAPSMWIGIVVALLLCLATVPIPNSALPSCSLFTGRNDAARVYWKTTGLCSMVVKEANRRRRRA